MSEIYSADTHSTTLEDLGELQFSKVGAQSYRPR